jgi:hypothetical protein
MRSAILVSFFLALLCPAIPAQQPGPPESPPLSVQQPAPPETEKIEVAPAPSPAGPGAEGFMEPAQVKAILQRLWLAEYRLNDLLSQVRPERWKLGDATRNSFQQTFDALRSQLQALEGWRGQLDARPDSMYLGYMLHASIDALLPRLDAVTRMISTHENTSLGAQFSQAGNQLFDLQQELQPYLVYLLRNQDQVLQATQTNLAACQNELSYAMRGRTERAKPMKNIRPDFKGRRKPKPLEAGKENTAPVGGAAVKKP